MLVKSVLIYGCEVWVVNQDLKKRITTVEMDYLRRSDFADYIVCVMKKYVIEW